MDKNITRRDFIKYTGSAGAAVALASCGLNSVTAAGNSNSKVVVAVAGIHSRGKELVGKLSSSKYVHLKYVIDVDSRYLPDAVKKSYDKTGREPIAIRDYRKALDDKDVDAIVIATPDHWHAPMSIDAVKAGKHVYVEKPCCHNPHEGELLVAAQKKYGKLVQMGNQRRSVDKVIDMVNELSNGVIGDIYLAKCFYTRKREPIGFGKVIDVPDYLDWDLWQGPAPRTAYRSNVHPYNWHWFWNWGTGEALNNGVHMLDVAHWAMNPGMPIKVSSFGGRWHYKGVDDWQCPDTQEIMHEFEGGKMITWFGRSTNTFQQGYKCFGIIFFGSKGIMDYDGGHKYKIYDLDNNLVKSSGYEEDNKSKKVDQANTADPGLQDTHVGNFIESIRGNDKLNSPIDIGYRSTLLGLLGNISLRVGKTLYTDKTNGRILNDIEAQSLWKRPYEPGWEPKI